MKKYITLILTICIGISFADSLNSIIDEDMLYGQKSSSAASSQLNNTITIKRNFTSIDEVATSLRNTTNYTTKIASYSADPINPVYINLKETKEVDFLNIATQKLNYKWSESNGVIIFTANNPVKPKPIIVTQQPATPHSIIVAKSTPTIPTWTLSPNDRMLRNALSKWSRQAGWQLVWSVKADYPITTSWVIQGSFESAINQILQATQTQDTPLYGTMYDANKVLEIRSSAN